MEPRISIIVPIYKVEVYLRRCIDSILRQTYQNIEIILVDDGSPDGCGAICDAYAAKDDRIRVIHKENGGLSDARNAGLDVATGDYIGFVDSDDWIAPDMYAYLLDGLTRSNADVAICEYYNVFPKRRRATRRDAERHFYGDRAVEALLQLKIGNYAWNKLYKRALWDDLRFAVGEKYEDVRVMYRLFGKCSHVVALPEPKYFYLQNDFGIVQDASIANKLSCIGARIERYGKLDAGMIERCPMLHEEIYRYALELRDTVCKKSAAEFRSEKDGIAAVSAFLKENQKEILDSCGLGRIGKTVYTCLTVDQRPAWKASKVLSDLYDKKTAWLESDSGSIAKRVSDAVQRDSLLISYYREFASLPLDEHAALVESRGGIDFASNVYYLAQELCSRGMTVYLSAYEGDEPTVRRLMKTGSFPGLKIVHKLSREYYHALATAKYLFNDMIYNDAVMKKEGQVWVNLWHGTPLKHLEMDVRNDRHRLGGTARDLMRTDYLVAPSKFMADKLLDSAFVRDLASRTRVVYTGYPRNAVFFDEAGHTAIRKACGIDDKEVYVYMPTWRGTFSSQTASKGSFSMQSILDRLDAHLRDDQILYVKLHNLDASVVDLDNYVHIRPFPKQYEPYAFLNAADCLITDYSSVFFDFANTRRKIILFAYDKEDYFRSRGVYIPFESLPFAKAETYDELFAALNLQKDYDDTAFVQTYCTYDSPEASKKLLDFVLDGAEAPVEKVQGNGKENVLVYDAGFHLRGTFPDAVTAYLEELSARDDKNYFYAYRTALLEKCPAFLQELGGAVRPFALTNEPIVLKAEKLIMKLTGKAPETLLRRERNREMYTLPFAEAEILNNNAHDPFAPMLKKLIAKD